MKKVLFIICFAIIGGFVWGQDWAPVGAKWYYNYTIEVAQHSFAESYMLFESIKDTLIENKKSKVIRHSYYSIKDNKLMSFKFGSNYFYLYWNNDSLFEWINNKLEFQYSFNHKKGDTLIKNSILGDTVNLIIDSITIKTFNNVKLRCLNFSYYAKGYSGYMHKVSETIIERIGNNIGFRYRPQNLKESYEGYWFLRCYSDNEIGVYHAPKEIDNIDINNICDTVLYPTNIIENNLGSPTLFPNPASDYLTLGNNLKIEYFEISDIAGKIILQEKNILHNNKINILFLGKGIYFLKIFSNNKLYNYKFIKT